MNEPFYPGVSPVSAGLRCRCPRCGEGRLYEGLLTVRAECEICGLDLRAQDSGDGPAVFVILFLGFLVVGLAILVETVYEPPYWVHVAIWPPAILFLSLAMLRPLKAILVALQFRHKILARDE